MSSKDSWAPSNQHPKLIALILSSTEEMHWSNGPQPRLSRDQAVPKGGVPDTLCFGHLSAWAVAAA